jgi:molybdate transport system substrate-binding protein
MENKRMKKHVTSLIFTVMSVLLVVFHAHAGEINISAAASLKETVLELAAGYSKSKPDVRFQTNFGGSGALAKQIENGAPSDLFISANMEWMSYLKEKRLIDEKSLATLAYNTLVFVGKPDSKITGLRDVLKLERIAIGSPKSVPAGEYAMEAFKTAGLEKQLENKLVMAKDVRECLLYAERGEVSGAFVYKTDVLEMAKNVQILFTVPQDLYSRVTYPMALTVSGSKSGDAQAFIRYLLSADAKTILTKHGFMVK